LVGYILGSIADIASGVLDVLTGLLDCTKHTLAERKSCNVSDMKVLGLTVYGLRNQTVYA